MKKLRQIESGLFLLLLFIIPFNTRYILNYEAIKSIEGFRESVTFFISSFDILFLLVILIFITRKVLEKKYKQLLSLKPLILFLLFAFVLGISSFLSDNQNVAAYNSIRLLEGIVFFFITKQVVKSNPKFFFQGLYVFFLSGVIQSTIAILQFVNQKSVGLFVFGESKIAPHILGVAKIEHAGEKMIRAYGTLPHPNILGAFLLLSFISGIYLLNKKSQHPLFILDSKIIRKLRRFFKNNETFRTVHIFIGLGFIAFGIILTFSRSTWLVVAVLITYAFIKFFKAYPNYFPVVNRVFFSKNKIKKTKAPKNQQLLIRDTLFLASLYIILIFVFLAPFVGDRLCVKNCSYDEAYILRQEYIATATSVVEDNPLWGVGPGNFTSMMNNYTERGLLNWERQPVHNLYFLIASEIGVIGLIVLVYYVVHSIKFNPAKSLFGMLFLGYLVLGFFDHFLASIFQGQLMFWACLAFFLSSCRINKGNYNFSGL